MTIVFRSVAPPSSTAIAIVPAVVPDWNATAVRSPKRTVVSPAAIVKGNDRPMTPSWIAGSEAPFGSGWKSSVRVPAPAPFAAASRRDRDRALLAAARVRQIDREHGMRQRRTDRPCRSADRTGRRSRGRPSRFPRPAAGTARRMQAVSPAEAAGRRRRVAGSKTLAGRRDIRGRASAQAGQVA